VSIDPIHNNEQLSSDAELIGFCFPVYAFGIPRICRHYLKQLKRSFNSQQVFIIITAGKKEESGFSINECVRILSNKNFNIIYSAVVEMPINWITYMNPPAMQEAQTIIDKGVEYARKIGIEIINGEHHFHHFNIPAKYGRFGLYKEYYLFKYLGVKYMWRSFNVYDMCNGCGMCAKICPTHSIQIIHHKPQFSSSCEQCMRCVNYCTQEAIYQSLGGDNHGRNRYHVPDFKPYKNE